VRAKEVVLQEADIAKALSDYIRENHIRHIVLGASTRGAIARAFKAPDVPTCLAKCAPAFCTVYVASKAKVIKLKSSDQPDTPASGSTASNRMNSFTSDSSRVLPKLNPQESWKTAVSELSSSTGDNNSFMDISDDKKRAIPFSTSDRETSRQEYHHELFRPQVMEPLNASYESLFRGSSYSSADLRSSDNPFRPVPLSNRQPSGGIGTVMPSGNYNINVRTKESQPYSLSGSSYASDGQSFPSELSYETLDQVNNSDSSKGSTSSQATDIEEELNRLKQDMVQLQEKYNIACEETAAAKDKMREIVPGSSLEEAKEAQEAAMIIIEMEKQKSEAALEMAQKSARIAELESEKRKQAEMKYRHEVGEKQKALHALTHREIRYRRYTTNEIEVSTNYFSSTDKIGEGGYGPVFKAILDHTAVAIKVLRPDISQGEKQFHQEVEVLSRMRHPHMVILLGACPEYGCLVYEYMDNGSLEDRLYRKNGSNPIPWSDRFRIAAEIGTALNFLHKTRPEPLVHRDLKPANILLDRNYVSKISDVGLAKLVPPSVADSVTQYHMTAAAGTFCYIDPEYQQTGMLGTKSDIYSFGIILLQILTAKPAMGLTHHVESAIEADQFETVLDPTVHDWPVTDALSLAKLALQCCELRKRDRPDLDSVILPELQRLRELGSQLKPKDRFHSRYTKSQSFKGRMALFQEQLAGYTEKQEDVSSVIS
ncbi:hypothetical protein M569_15807, partial [Genlisea aurea]